MYTSNTFKVKNNHFAIIKNLRIRKFKTRLVSSLKLILQYIVVEQYWTFYTKVVPIESHYFLNL